MANNTIQRAEDILDTAIAEQDLHRDDLDDPYRELLLTLALDVATAEADLRAETDTGPPRHRPRLRRPG